MSWQWLDSRTIRHSDGHTIELKSGSWKIPMDIEPRFASMLDGIAGVRLIRTGLEFAASIAPAMSNSMMESKNSKDTNSGIAIKPGQRSRPVLTLNKEKVTG